MKNLTEIFKLHKINKPIYLEIMEMKLQPVREVYLKILEIQNYYAMKDCLRLIQRKNN